MDTNRKPDTKRPTHKQMLLAVLITAITAVITALAHTAILLFNYDPSLGVYIYDGSVPTIFVVGMVIGLAMVVISALSIPSGSCGVEQVAVCGTAEAFFAAMAGAAMLAYSVMSFISASITEKNTLLGTANSTVTTLWALLAVLSIPSAAYLIISAITKRNASKKLTALVFFPVLWSAVCLLRIYFDRSSAINDPVKIYSQMALAAIMLFLLSELRIRVGKSSLRMYTAFAGIAAVLGFSYSVSVTAAYLAGVKELSGELLLAVVILLSAAYGFSRAVALKNSFNATETLKSETGDNSNGCDTAEN